MLTAYMRHRSLGYLANLAARFRHRTTEGRQLAKWVLQFADHLALPGYADNPQLLDELTRQEEVSADEWERLCETLTTEFRASKCVRADRTAQRIRRLGRYMRLSRTDIVLLELLLCYETQPVVESMVDDILCRHGFARVHCQFFSIGNPGLAHMLGISMGTLRRRLAVDSPLVRSGLLSVDDDGDFKLLQRLLRLAHAPARSGADVQQLLFDKASAAELEWQDFDHVAAGRDHVERLIGGALKTGERGVNVLIYGPPGTGKTQFCRTLAHRLGITMYSVGEADERGREPSRGERLQELRLAQRVLGDCGNSILLFDEMEDLLADPGSMFGWLLGGANRMRRGADGSKVFMNRLLEQTEVPTLWATNSARQTCPAVLRRMMFALELRQPSPRVRARIWARRFSLCLQGPPGTGKSAFVRYLAERVGLEVVQKRASDLMSMWVGQTEKQIAEAFAEARDQKHFLVFDEADSLLSDRRFAHRSWEVSQVASTNLKV